jgi:hypothetical protein
VIGLLAIAGMPARTKEELEQEYDRKRPLAIIVGLLIVGFFC